MKRFHEVAHIKEGNRRVGYIMKPGDLTTLGKWYLADEAAFTKTVREGKVQYFEPDKDGNPTIKYSQEELNVLSRLGSQPLYGKDYWSEDLSFRKSSIDDMLNRGSVILLPLSVANMGGFRIVVFTSFMRSSNSPVFQEFICQFLANSAFAGTIKNGGNNFQFSLSEYDFSGSNCIFGRAKSHGIQLITDVNNLERKAKKGFNNPLYQQLFLTYDKVKDIISILKKYEVS